MTHMRQIYLESSLISFLKSRASLAALSMAMLVIAAGCSDESSTNDTGVSDKGVVDASVDTPVRDAGGGDAKVADLGTSDATVDTAVPDSISFDQYVPPDLSSVPDAAGVDILSPDMGLPVPASWVTIQPGTFMMGSPSSEPCRSNLENLHQVTLTRKFEMTSTETTQGQFQGQMGYSPSNFQSCGTNCPVEQVSWHEAAAYCNALSPSKGLAQCYNCTGSGSPSVVCQEATSYSGSNIYNCPGYRLPTEAEWEYACRAGTTTAYYNGAINPAVCAGGSCVEDVSASNIGWYCFNAASTTHVVGQKSPNAWGLKDMAGNVSEWCNDYLQHTLTDATDPTGPTSGGSRVKRGGSWFTTAEDLRSANRVPGGGKTNSTGFRCVRSVQP